MFTKSENIDGIIMHSALQESPSRFLNDYDDMTIEQLEVVNKSKRNRKSVSNIQSTDIKNFNASQEIEENLK